MIVTVFGDVMLDVYSLTKAVKPNPESSGTVYLHLETRYGLGGAGSVAWHCRRMGMTVLLYGVLGSDDNADIIRAILGHEGIEDFCEEQDIDTTVKRRMVCNEHLLPDRFDTDGQASALNLSLIPAGDVSIIVSHGKGAIGQETVRQIIDSGVPVVADPGPLPANDNYGWFSGVTLLKVNRHERNGAAVLQSPAVITDGPNGMYYVRRDTRVLHAVAMNVEVADATGAGDAVLASLASSVVRGDDEPTTLAHAVRAGANACTHLAATDLYSVKVNAPAAN